MTAMQFKSLVITIVWVLCVLLDTSCGCSDIVERGVQCFGDARRITIPLSCTTPDLRVNINRASYDVTDTTSCDQRPDDCEERDVTADAQRQCAGSVASCDVTFDRQHAFTCDIQNTRQHYVVISYSCHPDTVPVVNMDEAPMPQSGSYFVVQHSAGFSTGGHVRYQEHMCVLEVPRDAKFSVTSMVFHKIGHDLADPCSQHLAVLDALQPDLPRLICAQHDNWALTTCDHPAASPDQQTFYFGIRYVTLNISMLAAYRFIIETSYKTPLMLTCGRPYDGNPESQTWAPKGLTPAHSPAAGAPHSTAIPAASTPPLPTPGNLGVTSVLPSGEEASSPKQTQVAASNQDKTSPSLMIIVGVCVGGLVLLIVIIVTTIVCCRKQKTQPPSLPTPKANYDTEAGFVNLTYEGFDNPPKLVSNKEKELHQQNDEDVPKLPPRLSVTSTNLPKQLNVERPKDDAKAKKDNFQRDSLQEYITSASTQKLYTK